MKIIQPLFLATLCLFTWGLSSSCQSKKIPGVYAGIELGISPMMGGGMTRTDVVIYLREDGTFTNKMGEPGWKTDIKGKYTVSGNKLVLQYDKNDKKQEYTIAANGNLKRGGYILSKMDVCNSVPAGVYQFKSASGSGGIGTPAPYVGHFSNSILNFDGKGNFSTSRYSVVSVIGDNIGGGTTNSSDGEGTYTIKDGELTLKFKDGKVLKQSFYAKAGKGEGDAMAVINGKFYFQKTKEELAKMKAEEEKRKPVEKSSSSPVNNFGIDEKLPTASDILTNLRNNYGGTAIDEVKTILLKGKLAGIDIISRIDLVNKRFRYEAYQNNKLLAVQQADGSTGWQWQQGKGKTDLDKEKTEAIGYSVYTGLTGLRSEFNSHFASGKVQKMKNGYTVAFQVNGNTFMYAVDNNFNLLGDGYKIGKDEQTSTYSNFRTVNGIKVPFAETVSRDGKKIAAIVEKYEVNTPLQTDWTVPQ